MCYRIDSDYVEVDDVQPADTVVLQQNAAYTAHKYSYSKMCPTLLPLRMMSMYSYKVTHMYKCSYR